MQAGTLHGWMHVTLQLQACMAFHDAVQGWAAVMP